MRAAMADGGSAGALVRREERVLRDVETWQIDHVEIAARPGKCVQQANDRAVELRGSSQDDSHLLVGERRERGCRGRSRTFAERRPGTAQLLVQRGRGDLPVERPASFQTQNGAIGDDDAVRWPSRARWPTS